MKCNPSNKKNLRPYYHLKFSFEVILILLGATHALHGDSGGRIVLRERIDTQPFTVHVKRRLPIVNPGRWGKDQQLT